MKKVNLNEVKNKILPVFLLILLLVGGSYAWFNYVKVGDKTQVVRAGKYSFKLEECENDIILKNAVPESAKKGLEEDVCTFRVQNTGSVSGEYTVYLDDEELEEKEKRMNDSFVRYSLVKGDEEESEEKTKLLTTTGTNPERVMATGTLNKGEEDVYHLKVWIDSEATNEVMSTIFYGKLRVKIDQTTKQTVTINPNGGVYNKKKENTVIAKKTGETVEIVGEPEREGYEFAGWDIEEGTVITGNIITVGKKNITLKAKWNVSKDAVARINDNYYTSLEKALEAAKETGDTIVMVKDTSESVVNQKDVTLDLENHTVTSKEEQTIINNGTLRVIKNGTIENTNKKVIVNNGVLILGEDDSEVSQKNPYIKGSELGIEQKGIMKFYDGLVEAKVGITGEVNEVAEGHYVFVDHDDQTGNQKVYLVETLTKAVVKTNGTIPIYYFNLQDAINTTTITQEKIEAIRNFEAAYELAIKADTNIGIDIKGYTVETGNKITNEGNLTIKDTGSEKGLLKPSVSITNNGKLIFEGISVEETTDVNVVENSGNLEINSSTLTAKGGYVVNNKENGVINSNDSGVIKGTNGIKVSGTNTIKSAHIELTSSGYGIYGVDSTGNTIVENVSIVGTNGTGIQMDAGNIVVNNATMDGVYRDFYFRNYSATGTINGGSYTNATISVASHSGDLQINGGTFVCKGSYECFSLNKGVTTVNNATVSGSTGIYVNGRDGITLNLNNSTVTGTGSFGVRLDGTYGSANIKKSTIKSEKSDGIYSYTSKSLSIEDTSIVGYINGLSTYNKTNIKGSEIIGQTKYGIRQNSGNSTLTIGEDDDDISTTAPIIKGDTYGLYIENGITNIYDGIFKGQTGGYSGTITTMPDGYTLKEGTEDIDGVIYKTNYLGENTAFLQVGDKKFNTINKAIAEAKETGNEIVLIDDANTTAQGTIDENVNITIDLNGHTLSMSQPLSSAGNLTLKDSSDEKSGKLVNSSTNNNTYVIESTGTLNLGDVNILGYNGIKAGGVTTIDGTKIELTNSGAGVYGVSSTTDITIENVSIVGTNGTGIQMDAGNIVVNNATMDGVYRDFYFRNYSATGTINGGSYTNATISVASHSGDLQINGGTFVCKGSYECFSLNKGVTTVNNATVSGSTGIYVNGRDGITLNLNNSTVTGTGSFGVRLDGTYGSANIKKSTIKSEKSDGIYSYTSKSLSIEDTSIVGYINGLSTYNKTNIKGSEIIGQTKYGIRQNSGNSTLTIGEDDDDISTTAPIIKGDTYGLYIENGITNIYDGIFKGQTGGYSGTITTMPDGYTLKEGTEDIDGVIYKTNYLGENTAFLQVGDKKFNTINKAIAEAKETGNEIVLIDDANTTAQGTIDENVNITIDLNGHTLSMSQPLSSAGNLTLKDSGEEKSGKLVNSSTTNNAYVIESTGTLNIGDVNISGYNGIKAGGVTTIDGTKIELTNSGIGIYGVSSTTDITIENVFITETNGTGIRMDAGNIVINDATVETGSNSIYMYNYNATGTINGGSYTSRNRTIATASKDLKINGGSYISSNSDGIYISNGITTVKSAVIDGKSYGINIYNTNSVTLNIGDDDNNIDGSSPVIKGETYGVYYINGKVNFYDGIVKGQTASFNKTPTSLAANSSAIEDDETIDEKNYQITYLTPDVITVKNGEKEYKNLQTAIDEASNNDELKVVNNITAYYNIIVPNNKNITIDTNGYTLNCGKGIVNNGVLNIKNDSSNQGILKTNTSVAVVTNNGNLSITNNKVMNDKTSTAVVENKGSLTTNSVDISSIYYGIGNSKNANLTLTDTNITSNSYALDNNSGTVNINGGTYTSVGYSINNHGSTNDEVTASKVIATGMVLTGRIYNSNATTEIDNSNVEYSYNGYSSYSTINNTNGVLKIISTDVNIDSMYTGNSDTTNPNVIYTSNGDLTIKSLSLTATGNRKYNQIVSGIKIDSKTTDDNTILIDDVTTNISSKQQGASVYITGGANSSDIQIKNAKFNVNEAVTGYGIYETSTSNDFNVNLISGNIYTNATTAYGVYVDSGSLTMGIKDGDGSENATVDKENPFVKAVGTTGIGVKKNNGYFKYYDGKIMGSTNAKPDTTTDTEYNYEAVMHTDQETGYEYCVLEYMK